MSQTDHYGWQLGIENLSYINVLILHPLVLKMREHNIKWVKKREKRRAREKEKKRVRKKKEGKS